MAEVVGGDGKNVAAELEFQDAAGGGEFGAGLGEVAFGFNLAVAGAGVVGFQGGEFCQQLGAERGFCLSAAVMRRSRMPVIWPWRAWPISTNPCGKNSV